jgi:hypothetical protein
MTTSVSSEDNLDWAGDTGAQSGGDPYVDSGFTSPNLAGITSLLTPFKGIFDRLKSGSTAANDVNAALSVLSLIRPSLNTPQTKGWKGTIDLNKQFNRTPIAQPAYTPYAQSASPVMGRQFFTSTYGAAPPATPPASGTTPPAGGGTDYIDPNNETTTGGGLARGGEVNLRSGDFVIPADVVAFAGSGSSEAGEEVLAQLIRAVPIDTSKGDGMSDDQKANIDGVQPAAVARNEMLVRAEDVEKIGRGDVDRGAKELYAMMDRIRKHATGSKEQIKPMEDIRQFTPGGIAGYAGGGAVAFNAGGAAPPPPTAPLGASNEQNISEWAGPYVQNMLEKTSALTNAPYQAYQGPMVAGTAPLQSKVFGGLEGLGFPGQLGQSFTSQGAYQLPSMTPGGVTGQQAGPGGIASQYMNPYLSAVLTPQLDELRRQSQITQMGTAGKLAQAGAFGGSRQAIMDAETQRNLLQEQNKAIGTGYANAYDRAMGQFNTEQGQAKTLADMMAGAGQQQRGIEQEGITALQKQYETEQLHPYTNLRFQKEMLQGLPVATASTTANTSQMSEATQGMKTLQDALKALGLG